MNGKEMQTNGAESKTYAEDVDLQLLITVLLHNLKIRYLKPASFKFFFTIDGQLSQSFKKYSVNFIFQM